MGWTLRRSKKVGPFRINLSKSGIGLSAGIKGLRVGRDAKGRTYSSVSIPGTGLYNRTYQSKAVNKSSTTERQSVERAHPSGSQDRDLRYVGNIPQETLDFLASKKGTPPRSTGKKIGGFFLLASIFAFVSGHWILGVLFILLTVAASQPPSQETGALPSGSQDRET